MEGHRSFHPLQGGQCTWPWAGGPPFGNTYSCSSISESNASAPASRMWEETPWAGGCTGNRTPSQETPSGRTCARCFCLSVQSLISREMGEPKPLGSHEGTSGDKGAWLRGRRIPRKCPCPSLIRVYPQGLAQILVLSRHPPANAEWVDE